MARIALVGSYASLEKLEKGILRIERMINQKGKAVDWWSYPIKHCKDVYEAEKPFWFYLYCNGKIKVRYRIIDFVTNKGNEGIKCPEDWKAYLVEPNWEGKKKISDENKTWIFKTWFLIDKVERLENPLSITNLKGFCDQDINTSRLRNSFLYIFDPLFSKEDLKKLIRNFVKQSVDKDNLETKSYKAFYKDLEIKVSFGQGSHANVSWIAFLDFNQKVSKGIYPVVLFNRENCIVVAYGVSETNLPETNWSEDIIGKYSKINDATCNCDLSKIKEKYGNSYLRECFKVKDNLDSTLNNIVDALDEVINDYKKIFSKHELREKITINTEYSVNKLNCFSKKLNLDQHTIKSFYNSLKTKGFVILAGLSGTGKTKIFEEFVKCFPEIKMESEVSNEGLVEINIKPAYISHNLINIPVRFWKTEDALLPSLELGQKKNIKLFYKEIEYNASLNRYGESLLRLNLPKEFVKLISKERKIYLEPLYEEEFIGFNVLFEHDLNKQEELVQNFLFVSVRPDFKDTKSLLGFHNPLKETYHSTPLLEFILRASKNYLEKGKEADPFFILFDEMNLARVEYYFADFLSILETKRFESKSEALKECKFKEFVEALGFNSDSLEDNFRFTSQSTKLHSEDLNDVPQELFLPPNLYFVGTVNIDETTYMFSPKVLDRSFSIEFDVGDFLEYLEFLKEDNTENNKIDMTEDFKTQLKKDFINGGKFAFIDKEKIKNFAGKYQNFVKELERINSILKPYNLHFGYRVFDEIMMFLYNSQNSLLKFENPNEAFDLAIKMKVLPKFNGTRQRLWNPIVKLLKEIGVEEPENLIENGVPNLKSISNQNYKYTVHKLLEMLYKLKTQGFTSFI